MIQLGAPNEGYPAMQYTFRPNLFQRHSGLQLTDVALQAIDKDGNVMKSIDLRSIRSLQRIDCGIAGMSDGRKEKMEHCVVRSGGLGQLTIKSASYAGPGEWDSHGAAYRSFVSDLMDKLARANPSATVTIGSGALVVVCRALQVASVLLILLGIAVLISILRDGSFGGQSTVIAAICLVGGVGGFGLSGSFAATHRPVTATVEEARAM